MPKKVTITDEHMDWLRANHQDFSYTHMARHVGVCTDTLKRILAREGLQEFDAAKYVPALKVETWDRPCIQCASREVRHKNWFMCSDCRRKAGYEDV